MKKIASKEAWIIMDKTRKAIACGSPRDRRMVLIKNLDTGRILTYQTEARARAGFKTSGFWDETWEEMPKSRWQHNDEENPTYLNITYGELKDSSGQYGKFKYWSNPSYEEMCIPVKAIITVEVEDESAS